MIELVTDKKRLRDFYLLSAYAFSGGKTGSAAGEELYYERSQHTHNYGLYQDGQLASKVTNYPFEVNVFGQKMKMGGIGGVATYPEYRGEGGIRQLFTQLFADYYASETVLSYLAPFSHPFYRKFGYATAITNEQLIVKNDDFRTIPGEERGTVRRGKWTDEKMVRELQQLYAETLGKQNGMLVREDWWNEYQAADYQIGGTMRFAVAYDEEGIPQGYVLYGMTSDKSIFKVHEFGHKNRFAFRKLLNFISSHAGSFKNFIFELTPADEWADFLFSEPPAVKRNLESGMMIRIVLWEQFLNQFPFEKGSTLPPVVIEVKDESCPWNQKKWQLSVRNGKGTVSAMPDSASADITADIQALTQWFFSSQSAETLYYHGFLQGNEEKVSALDKLLPKEAPHVVDTF